MGNYFNNQALSNEYHICTQEVFGCSETCGPQATNKPDFGCFKPGSVGREHVGVKVGK